MNKHKKQNLKSYRITIRLNPNLKENQKIIDFLKNKSNKNKEIIDILSKYVNNEEFKG